MAMELSDIANTIIAAGRQQKGMLLWRVKSALAALRRLKN